MSLKLEILSPERLFFSKENVYQVIIPAYEGEMGILQDHIPIISFLKPGTSAFARLFAIDSCCVAFGNMPDAEINSPSIMVSRYYDW